jgi:hypothetical protein
MAARELRIAIGLFASLLVARDASADKPWVDRPLTLPPLHVSADGGVGFAQYEHFQADATGTPVSQGNQVGYGASLEAAVGIPFLGEIGVRGGYRFDAAGRMGQADHFARLFDPVPSVPGTDPFANPEIRLRNTVLPLEIVEVGLETRFIIPTATGSSFGLTTGIPVRIHIPQLLRIDTCVFLPVSFDSPVNYSVDLPVQAFFQVGNAFFGPFTGVRYNHRSYVDATGTTQTDDSTDVPVGLGGGYTLGGIVDLKAQLRTERVNSPNWANGIGGGIGAGLRFP